MVVLMMEEVVDSELVPIVPSVPLVSPLTVSQAQASLAPCPASSPSYLGHL